MAEKQMGKNGESKQVADKEPQPMQAQVIAQYVKDLSFENPNVAKLLGGPGEEPNMTLEVNVNAQRLPKPDLYESAIELTAKASSKSGTIYILEITYAGLFRLQNVPEPALEPFLLVNCPTLIFPFLRRLAADISREGAFPPLMLDPIDFGALYVNRQKQAAEASKKSLS
jgi:preprotein translocase subunit SecB